MKSLYKIFMLLSLLLSCTELQKIPGNDCRLLDLEGPFDLQHDRSLKENRLIISSQNRRLRDPNGELMKEGSIYELVIQGGNEQIRKLTIKNRDEFPFHPSGMSLLINDSTTYLYVINDAMTVNHVVEIFSLSKKELNFIRRIKIPFTEYPVNISVTGLNSFIVYGDGSLYGPEASLFSRKPSDVLLYNGRWRTLPKRRYTGTVSTDQGSIGFRAFTTKIDKLNFSLENSIDSVVEDYTSFDNKITGLSSLNQALIVTAVDDASGYKNFSQDSLPYVSIELVENKNKKKIFFDRWKGVYTPSVSVKYQGRIYTGQRLDHGLLSCREN